MIRSWLFRALNRADRDYPRYERVIETAGTVTAIVVYLFFIAAGGVREVLMRRGRT